MEPGKKLEERGFISVEFGNGEQPDAACLSIVGTKRVGVVSKDLGQNRQQCLIFGLGFRVDLHLRVSSRTNEFEQGF